MVHFGRKQGSFREKCTTFARKSTGFRPPFACFSRRMSTCASRLPIFSPAASILCSHSAKWRVKSTQLCEKQREKPEKTTFAPTFCGRNVLLFTEKM